MVKARCCSPSSSQQLRSASTSCAPLASLSLASTLLKPIKPSRPSFLSFLKRPPFVNTPESNMDLLSSPPPSPLYSSSEGHCTSRQVISEDEATNIAAAEEMSMQTIGRLCTTKTADSQLEDEGSEKEIQGLVCGRQRLQQHRIQMAGKVIIPDTWGREQQLQDWVSYGIVEDALRPSGLMSARTALVNECQHRGNKPVRT